MTFIGGGEESFGYNVGSFVRDKDAVISCALVAEVAAWAADMGESLYDLLLDIYVTYGLFKERLHSIAKKGKDGLEQIDAMMKRFRSTPPLTLCGAPVVLIHDFQSSETIDLISDLRYQIALPKSNVLQFITQDNTIVSIRPSGTEPKIKFYFGVRATLSNRDDYCAVNTLLESKLQQLEKEIAGGV